MKGFGFASIAAAALSGALFATSVSAADLPPIVIKVQPLIFILGSVVQSIVREEEDLVRHVSC